MFSKMSDFSRQVQDLIDILESYSLKVYEIQESQCKNVPGHPHNHDGLPLDEAKMDALNSNDAYGFIHQSKEDLWALSLKLEKIRDKYWNKNDLSVSTDSCE